MGGPAFILTTDHTPPADAWSSMDSIASGLREFASRAIGVEPRVGLARLPSRSVDEVGDLHLGRVIDRYVDDGASIFFVLPTEFELNVWQRAILGEELAAARRRHPGVSIHHDSVDPAHPLLVDCFVARVLDVLGRRRIPPGQAGLIVLAEGRGDPSTRADGYRLMRLVWEQAGMKHAEVGFVRHAQPFLRDVLRRCLREPLEWLLLPQCQWGGDLCDYARVMLDDHRGEYAEAGSWDLLEPPGDHPAIRAWLEQRVLRLWQEKRATQAVRVPSLRHQPAPKPAAIWSGNEWIPAGEPILPTGTSWIARAREPGPLGAILSRVLPPSDRYLVKVTWHGYAQGTYTGAAALDLLLGALPGRAVILEGHTSSRNIDAPDFDWEHDAIRHRAWIRRQDVEFLQRTGLSEVMARHGAQYLNVTEAWWDGACAPAEEVGAAIGEIQLRSPELAGFVPSALMELRGTPFLSFARFKGPTRLGISNLFGLIPHPLRTGWHGADITDFASVCCDLALLYGRLFPLFGLVEAFDSAVRWDRKGLYRSRWGNYDLVLSDGLFTLSSGLVGADLLASRLQGQDVSRSGFYDVVRERLGWPPGEADLRLPAEIVASLV